MSSSAQAAGGGVKTEIRENGKWNTCYLKGMAMIEACEYGKGRPPKSRRRPDHPIALGSFPAYSPLNISRLCRGSDAARRSLSRRLPKQRAKRRAA